MKRVYPILIACLLAVIPVISGAEITINSVITIKPGNPDNAAERIIHQAQKLKGYFVSKSSESVALKVPNMAAGELQKFIEDNWLIYQQAYQAPDVTAQLIDIQSRLKAKEELLDEYQSILNSAPADKIVTVATAVSQLVEDIELLRGQVRLLQHQIQFATITVNFNIDRNRLDQREITSSFAWINTLGLDNILREFSQ